MKEELMKLRKRNMSERAQLEERCRKVCDEMEAELEDEQAKVKAAEDKLVCVICEFVFQFMWHQN